MTAPRLQLVARTGHPRFLDLPWQEPLADWRSERLVELERGISRHVVRFVEYEGRHYALKELPGRLARREYRLLRALAAEGLPAVKVVGVASGRGEGLDDVLITRHLDFSLPFRALLARRNAREIREPLIEASAELLVRLHLAGFYWGDCSLSNTLFRRDAGQFAAYVVDVETGELHEELSDGQRRHDMETARENVTGELLDVAAELGLDLSAPPEDTADELVARYERLWDELTREDVFAPDERYRIDERLQRVNELGFDVEEIELLAEGGELRLRLSPRVVEPGHHRRRLFELTGLRAQENQARRMLNDLARFRAHLEHEAGAPVPETIAAHRWVTEVFEPAIAAVPNELWGKREPAEVFHEILDHRWYLSELAGRDVGFERATETYVNEVLRELTEERTVLPVEGLEPLGSDMDDAGPER